MMRWTKRWRWSRVLYRPHRADFIRECERYGGDGRAPRICVTLDDVIDGAWAWRGVETVMRNRVRLADWCDRLLAFPFKATFIRGAL